jgi:hypothetical protein
MAAGDCNPTGDEESKMPTSDMGSGGTAGAADLRLPPLSFTPLKPTLSSTLCFRHYNILIISLELIS